MAKDAIVSDELAQKFATEKDTPYLRFVRGEGLDIIGAHYVPSLRTVELKPWARRGGNAVFINHEASRTSNDCYVLEIPPGKSLAPTRHLFEEMIFILDGRGSTTVWNDAGQRVTFEWRAGALFGIPMNCWHRHFNGSGQAGARYVAVTNAPPVINLYEDIDFVFNTTFDFKQRFTTSPPRRRPTACGSRPISSRMASMCRSPIRPSAAPAAAWCASISPGETSRAISRNSRSALTRRRMRMGRAPMWSSSTARAIP
jgi:mannose-6-phosphate isomerase-like protein (cupin superfamily)